MDVDLLADRDEVEAADSFMRDILRTALADARVYRKAQKRRSLSPKEQAAMLKDLKIVAEIRRIYAKQESEGQTRSRSRKSAERKGRKTDPASSLDHLATKLDGTGPEPASPQLPVPDAQLLGAPALRRDLAQTKDIEEMDSEAVADSLGHARSNGAGNDA